MQADFYRSVLAPRRSARPRSARGLLGQTPPSVQALLQQYGGASFISDAWGSVSGQIQQELQAGIISQADAGTLEASAGQHFTDAFNGLTSSYSPQLASEFAGVANAAASLAIGSNTAGGAVASIYGLLSPALGGQQPEQAAVQLFTGTLCAAVPIAVAAGAVSAGVGAAIVVGASLVGQLVGSLFNQPPPPGTNVCGWDSPYNPSISLLHGPPQGCAWSAGQPRNSPGAGSAPWSTAPDRLWRRFPNFFNPGDAPWFIAPSSQNQNDFLCGGNNCSLIWEHTWFKWGPQQDAWDFICQVRNINNVAEIQRPIDAAFPQYHQLECDLSVASPVASLPDGGGTITIPVLNQTLSFSSDDVMLARFIVGFVAAWQANAEYPLNGQQPNYTEDVLLAHYVRQWNYAHAPGATYTFQPRGAANLSDVIQYPDACQGTLANEWWYVQRLLQLPEFGGNPVTINTGAKYAPPTPPHLPPIPIHLPFPIHLPNPAGSTGKGAGSSSAVPYVLGGLALAAAAGAGGIYYYGRRRNLSFGDASRDIWDRIRHPGGGGRRGRR